MNRESFVALPTSQQWYAIAQAFDPDYSVSMAQFVLWNTSRQLYELLKIIDSTPDYTLNQFKRFTYARQLYTILIAIDPDTTITRRVFETTRQSWWYYLAISINPSLSLTRREFERMTTTNQFAEFYLNINPVSPTVPSFVASFGSADGTDVRAVAGGFTGLADADDYQREAAINVARVSDYEGGLVPKSLLLEDTVTPCSLVAPGVPVVTPGIEMFSATSTGIPVTASLLRYEYRLDGAGSWTSNGTSTTLTNITATSGSHVLNFRAVSTSGVVGATATSSSFSVAVDPSSPWTLLASTDDALGANGGVSSAINSTGADLLVAIFSQSESASPGSFSDSKGNTWVARRTRAFTGGAELRVYDCIDPVTVGTGHTVTFSGTGILGSVVFAAFQSAAGDIQFDQQNGRDLSQIDATTSATCGTITPAKDDALVITILGTNTTVATTNSVAGYTALGTVAPVSSANEGLDVAWKVEDAGVITKSWTLNSANSGCTKVVSYLSGAGSYVTNVDPATLTTGTQTEETTYLVSMPITLPDGMLTSIGLQVEDINFPTSVKFALHDASLNMVLNAGIRTIADSALTGQDDGQKYYDISGFTPVAVNGNYWINYEISVTGALSHKHLGGQPSGSIKYDLGSTYAGFPHDPLTGSDSTNKYACRAFVIPA